MLSKFLTKILLTFCISTLLINQSYAQELEYKSTSITNENIQTNKNFYITPHLGFSTLAGAYGIEVQYKNYGFNIGFSPQLSITPFTILSGGIRYYFKPSNNSWVIGVGGGVVLDDLKPDDNLCWGTDDYCEIGTVTDMYIGAIIGYRWTWWNKLHLNIGLGPNYIKWQKIKYGGKQNGFLMYDFVLGYTFNK